MADEIDVMGMSERVEIRWGEINTVRSIGLLVASTIHASFKRYLFVPILAVLLVNFPVGALTQEATTMTKASRIESFIEAVGKIRKTNNRTMVDCTELVEAHLGKSENISYYIDLFKEFNVEPLMHRQNQKNFIGFTLNYPLLRSVTPGFFTRDYIVVSFVTEKLERNSPIVSYKVTLLNDSGI